MTSSKYEIHPRIGVARLGNSPTDFYLAPETVGGLPLRCDEHGNPSPSECGNPYVDKFKDGVGRVLRQAARFRLFENDGDQRREISLDDDAVDHIEWHVHIANKKPIWFTFSELQGNLEFGPHNSYEEQHVVRNNPDVTDESKRKKLMIDPGPRKISSAEHDGKAVKISRYNIPSEYSYGSFPPVSAGGQQIDELGELRMNDAGHLIALGGYGNVTGSAAIESFRGAGGYWDDISDGYVLATVHLKDGTKIDAEPAWLLVGSPKYAPELVNITTLFDTMFDTGVRHMGADKDIFPGDQDGSSFPQHNGYTPLKGYNPDYEVNYTTQVLPILERIRAYRWVADIPYLASFSNPDFDLTDPSEANASNRQSFFAMFRVPVLPADYQDWIHKVPNGPNDLFCADTGMPLMPLNSGDNSVTNDGPIYKFETLSPTQYFFLYQWSIGKFTVGEEPALDLAERLDQVDVGNCVGAPFSPGIETTWITRNAPIYDAVARMKIAHFDGSNHDIRKHYRLNGLSMTADEATGGGCEPGDLTKRMAIPWQADFAECTVQTPNISDPTINQFADGTGIEVPPTYYVYWWPPQSPMHVVTGSLQPNDQVLDAVLSQIDGQTVIPAGQRVDYQRGVESPAQVIAHWSRLGFVVNQGTDQIPYFVETERNNEGIVQAKIGQGEVLKMPGSGGK